MYLTSNRITDSPHGDTIIAGTTSLQSSCSVLIPAVRALRQIRWDSTATFSTFCHLIYCRFCFNHSRPPSAKRCIATLYLLYSHRYWMPRSPSGSPIPTKFRGSINPSLSIKLSHSANRGKGRTVPANTQEGANLR